MFQIEDVTLELDKLSLLVITTVMIARKNTVKQMLPQEQLNCTATVT